MKFLTTLIAAMSAPAAEGSVRVLVRLVVVLTASVIGFAAGFLVLMSALEDREFTFVSAIYWAIVTMTTLGYGDIVFETDLGRMYSLVVLVAGAILILVMLPFTFIQLVYLPWREATRRARAPRELPASTEGHVIVTGLEPMAETLIHRLEAAGLRYTLLVEDVEEGVRLHDEGYAVAVGALDDPETYRAVRAESSAMLFTARADTTNTNVAFTMREVTDRSLVVATANSPDSVDVLELAGCDRVLQLGEMLGRGFARRILAPTARCSVVASFADLQVAEASAAGTELVDRSLADLDIRRRFGVSVVGIWDRGELQPATPDRTIEGSSILILVGRQEQLDAYDAAFSAQVEAPDDASWSDDAFVLILGGGRVGRATSLALHAEGMRSRIVERLPERIRDQAGLDYVVGDAADIEVLRRAGIDEASSIVVTTHDDDMNLYLTLYCRRLRPEAQILSRVNSDRNLSTMHRAGADLALSYASMGATEAWNALREDATLLLGEGLVVFRAPISERLAGRTLREADIPAETGCQVVAVVVDGDVSTDLDIDAPLPPDGALLLIGDEHAEERFLSRYVAGADRPAWRRWLTGSRS